MNPLAKNSTRFPVQCNLVVFAAAGMEFLASSLSTNIKEHAQKGKEGGTNTVSLGYKAAIQNMDPMNHFVSLPHAGLAQEITPPTPSPTSSCYNLG